MKYLDLFTGIGGFTKAIHDVLPEAECVGFSEIDKYAQQIYLKHYPKHKPYGDITKLTTDVIPDFDLLVGGFPCQSFSIAGKRRGFEDTRGTLFFEIARILRGKRPTNFVLENVAGLLSHDEGNTFKVIISTLDELGYFVEWQVLNSKNFGVPQNRERVFIVGHFGGIPERKVFPIRENDEVFNEQYTRAESETQHTFSTIATNTKRKESNYIQQNLNYLGSLGRTKKWNKDERDLSRNSSQGERVYDSEGLSVCLNANGGGLGAKTGLYLINDPIHSNDRVYTENGISPALNTMQGGNRQPKIKVTIKGKFQKTVYSPSGISPTVREGHGDVIRITTTESQDKHGIFDGSKIRRLTPLECERLQGFPDGWTEGISDTQRYKCLGNAVTVNVVREIIKRLF